MLKKPSSSFRIKTAGAIPLESQIEFLYKALTFIKIQIIK
jgi:hypothetical protein